MKICHFLNQLGILFFEPINNPTFCKTLSQSSKLCNFIIIDIFDIFFKNCHDIILSKSGKENVYIVFIIFYEEIVNLPLSF